MRYRPFDRMSSTTTNRRSGTQSQVRMTPAATALRHGERQGKGGGFLGRRRAVVAVGEPADDVAPMPADGTTVKLTLARKMSKSGHCREYPSMSARQARDLVAAQDFTPWRERFVDPPRYGHIALKVRCGDGQFGLEFVDAHCWCEPCAVCCRSFDQDDIARDRMISGRRAYVATGIGVCSPETSS